MISHRALIDSNVIITAVDADHPHHEPAATLLAEAPPRFLAVAAHSYAEAYSTLTRRDAASPFHWGPSRARAALDNVASFTVLIGMTPAQTLESVMLYGDRDGVGPRLFDYLIGRAAVNVGIKTIVTWNVRHLRGMFPDLDVIDPTQAIARTER